MLWGLDVSKAFDGITKVIQRGKKFAFLLYKSGKYNELAFNQFSLWAFKFTLSEKVWQTRQNLSLSLFKALTCFLIKNYFFAHSHPIQLCLCIYQPLVNTSHHHTYVYGNSVLSVKKDAEQVFQKGWPCTLDACIINFLMADFYLPLIQPNTAVIVCGRQDMEFKIWGPKQDDDNFWWEYVVMPLVLVYLKFNPIIRKKLILQSSINCDCYTKVQS